MSHPMIIQGGMGAAVSGWQLARTVSRLGQLGVVSGVALPGIIARRLQLGDLDGKLRHALQNFPIPEMAKHVLENYFVPGGKAPTAPFKLNAMPTLKSSVAFSELAVVASFMEVFLAKEGHDGLVGINLLEKIQLLTLLTLFGAMLAGVDYVLVGAGIPRSIPGVLDRFSKGETAELRVDVEGALPGEEFFSTFDPKDFCGGQIRHLKRPLFLGIVASATLAITLARKSNGRVDGFVVEGETAGGHNAPPRGPLRLSASGEPVYGPRDVPELDKIRALGLPFWLAGSYGQPGKLAEALRLGATGIQVGTAFAFCDESGISPALKKQAIALSRAGKAHAFTDPLASSTGYPFKVVQMEGTLSEDDLYKARPRVCDLGYLRHLYRKPDGTMGYRCPSEPVEKFVRKGGDIKETVGRKCICNCLPANVGLGQVRSDHEQELALVTAGNDVDQIARFLKPGHDSYTAEDVMQCLLADLKSPQSTG
ncbi:MAG: nitronate monooxygenase [Kiritimatiellia bacterium]|nr:nitronate monooxygenase [Kiritimatiellia bacterium]